MSEQRLTEKRGAKTIRRRHIIAGRIRAFGSKSLPYLTMKKKELKNASHGAIIRKVGFMRYLKAVIVTTWKWLQYKLSPSRH